MPPTDQNIIITLIDDTNNAEIDAERFRVVGDSEIKKRALLEARLVDIYIQDKQDAKRGAVFTGAALMAGSLGYCARNFPDFLAQHARQKVIRTAYDHLGFIAHFGIVVLETVSDRIEAAPTENEGGSD